MKNSSETREGDIQNNFNFKLGLEPSESRMSLNEDGMYTFRLPLTMFLGRNESVLKSILDTAKVAFAHNKSGSKQVIITCPEGLFPEMGWLREALVENGLMVEVRCYPRAKFAPHSKIIRSELCCVDRRLDDRGYDPFDRVAQITYAGGALVLDPELRSEFPVHHIDTLRRAVFQAADFDAPVGRLSYHFGAEGGSGCGMYAAMSAQSKLFQERLRSPGDIKDMLNRVRDDLGATLATNCHITGAVVNGDLDAIVYDLEDEADFEALLSESELVL